MAGGILTVKAHDVPSAFCAVRDWVSACYRIVGKEPVFKCVPEGIGQRNYFCFYDYEYSLDVSRQKAFLRQTVDLQEGLRASYNWYRQNRSEVVKKDYISYIDTCLTYL